MSSYDKVVSGFLGFTDAVSFFGGMALAVRFDLSSSFFWVSAVVAASGFARFANHAEVYDIEVTDL